MGKNALGASKNETSSVRTETVVTCKINSFSQRTTALEETVESGDEDRASETSSISDIAEFVQKDEQPAAQPAAQPPAQPAAQPVSSALNF